MKKTLFLLFLFIFTNDAFAQSIDKTGRLQEIYLVRHSKESPDMDVGYLRNRTTGELGEKFNFKKIISEGVNSWKGKNTPIKVISDHDRNDLFIITSSNFKKYKTIHVSKGRYYLEEIGRMFKSGWSLFSCSYIFNYEDDYTLLSFVKDKDNSHYWQGRDDRDYYDIRRIVGNEGKARSFPLGLEHFNNVAKQFYKDGKKNKYVELSTDKKYRIYNINYCNDRWFANYSRKSSFQGEQYTFKAKDFALFWKKVEEFRAKGVYLVDVEKGPFPTGVGFGKESLWYGVFSTNRRYKSDTIWKYYLNMEEFNRGEKEMFAKGFTIIDMEIAGRSGY